MPLTRIVAWSFPIGMILLGMGAVAAQNYPYKPIRVLASEPGAQVDFIARLMAPALTASLGQQIIVDNRPSGFILAQTARKAQPDGYTLLMQSSSFWVTPLMQTAPYDPVRDFSPVTFATNAPLFLFAHPSVPAKNARELIALAKAKPGELNYGSASAGTTNHLAFELFKSMAGVDIVRIPYKGTAGAAVGLIANQVQLMLFSALVGMSHVKGGRLRVLAAGSAKPSAFAPDVPTLAASGVPGYEAGVLSCAWVPAKTPQALVIRLNTEILNILSQPDIKTKLLASGIETFATTPDQAAAYIKADMAKLGKLIKELGIRED